MKELLRSGPNDGGGRDGRCAPSGTLANTAGPPLLVTVEEAAQLLRLGRTRTYQLVLGGAIRSVKIGRRRLVVRAGLEAFVASLLAQQG